MTAVEAAAVEFLAERLDPAPAGTAVVTRVRRQLRRHSCGCGVPPPASVDGPATGIAIGETVILLVRPHRPY